MLVYSYFEGDDDDAMKNLQYEMYEYSISTVIEKMKYINLSNPNIIQYFSKDIMKLFRRTESFDHRPIQGTHDIIAATFRFKVKNGGFDNEVPDKKNDEIKSLFRSIYIDTDFLNNIPVDYWNLAYKWHKYLIDTIKELSLIHEPLICALLFSITSQAEKLSAAADEATSIIKHIHNDIPWIKSKTELFFLEKERNRNNYKIKYVLYDYTRECKIGYGGTEYHNGYIIFYDNYLSIEDHEIDRDTSDDAWHGNYTRCYIQSDEYTKLINILSEEYQRINIEQENEAIKKAYSSLDTEDEKCLFSLLISVIKTKKDIMFGGELTRKICGVNIKYYKESGQYDDFYPDCDICNYHKTEIINDEK